MHYLIFFIGLLGSTILFSQTESDSINCLNYRIGDFYVLNGADTCFIRRTENRQYEKCNGKENTYELIVIWLKPTKYILRDIHYNPTNAAKIMREDAVITIIESQADYHIIHVRIRGQKPYNMTVYCLNR